MRITKEILNEAIDSHGFDEVYCYRSNSYLKFDLAIENSTLAASTMYSIASIIEQVIEDTYSKLPDYDIVRSSLLDAPEIEVYNNKAIVSFDTEYIDLLEEHFEPHVYITSINSEVVCFSNYTSAKTYVESKLGSGLWDCNNEYKGKCGTGKIEKKKMFDFVEDVQ